MIIQTQLNNMLQEVITEAKLSKYGEAILEDFKKLQ